VYSVWLDEARDRMRLEIAHGTFTAAALAAGAKRSALPDYTDPADQLADASTPPPDRDPETRAAQITAFIAATGGDTAGG